jgi:beta-RFAP synthase
MHIGVIECAVIFMRPIDPDGAKQRGAEVSRASNIHVRAFARLHLGFLDLNGSLGRQFGSIGLSLDDVCLELMAAPGLGFTLAGPGAARAETVARTVFEFAGHSGGVDLQILRAIPEHAGLGSGTQLALAVGTACARLAGVSLTVGALANLLLRGQRSGIGIGTYSQGGFVVDAGRGPATLTPPVISRLPVPDPWRFVLVMDRSRQGAHGDKESEAFSRLPMMPETQSAHLCRITLMRLLPALAEADCLAFGAAVNEIQTITGEHFSQWQSGRYSSPDVAAVLAFMAESGATGCGQSSWGPTGFAIFPEPAAAVSAMELARKRWDYNAQLDFVSCRAANHPAVVRSEPTAARQYAHG